MMSEASEQKSAACSGWNRGACVSSRSFGAGIDTPWVASRDGDRPERGGLLPRCGRRADLHRVFCENDGTKAMDQAVWSCVSRAWCVAGAAYYSIRQAKCYYRL